MKSLTLSELHALYRSMYLNGVVFAVELHSAGGKHIIKNQQIIRKVLSLLIRETKKRASHEENCNIEV